MSKVYKCLARCCQIIYAALLRIYYDFLITIDNIDEKNLKKLNRFLFAWGNDKKDCAIFFDNGKRSFKFNNSRYGGVCYVEKGDTVVALDLTVNNKKVHIFYVSKGLERWFIDENAK